ncbi:hypothetical protein PCANC_12507 [Puccinia coronata f. sp. avenae]|uniref:Integrase catalytic domain-containing protein n=1 Tax=Puccinia coronata f. sp. avenae TaxID=200324 RepID=A0A2N5SSK8_9BASI|nr:hypothetical protein PCANC_12507 [Puccinia coronata f. sp. avenae]
MLVTDVAGPFPMDLHSCQYMLTLRDHTSTYIWCDMLSTQAVVPHKVISWVEHIENTLGRYPKQIRLDNAPEYTGTLRKLLKPILGLRLLASGLYLQPHPEFQSKKCPLQKLYGVEPDPNALYPFGAKAIV